ncbi:uncharacterized protein [Antedon mediterranea]|uniref:uncharacterized protein n=1 Tax=Antedon mediterranea TaxID=105859 RepID=UPI003AF8B215
MAANVEDDVRIEIKTSSENLISSGMISNVIISNTSGNHVPFKLIESSDRVWIGLLKNPEIFGDNNYIRGFVNGPDELESILEAHKRATTSSFSVRTSNSKRDKSGAWKKNIQPVFIRNWEPKMRFDFTPFIVVKVTYMECEFGRDYWRKDKKQNDDHNYHNMSEDATLDTDPIPGSRKRGCLARLTNWEVLIFNEYKILNWSELLPHQLREAKSKKLDELRKRLHNNEEVPYETRFFLELPFKSAHKNHDQVSDSLQLRVHPKIIDRIHHHVRSGITAKEKVKVLVDTFVKQELSSCGVEPNPLDRSYHPTDRDLTNHIYRAINIEKIKRIDHNAILETISKLESSGQHIFYQPTSEKTCQKMKEKSEEDSIFMLVYQESWQSNLMKSRLRALYVIDSTYKTHRYPLPLYTLWIYIDEKFICVAIIIMQCDATDDLAQALRHLKHWNPNWNPEYFLMDTQQPCWKAVEQTFPNSKVFVSSFHCNQSWLQFLSSKKVNLSESSRLHVYSLLQRAANSSSKEGYLESIDMIQATQEWENSEYLRYVINRFWFHNSSKWAMSNQPEELVMAMSGNAQDKLKYALEYSYLPQIWSMSVNSLLEFFSGIFFPEVVRTDGGLELVSLERTVIDSNEAMAGNINVDNPDDYDDDYDLNQSFSNSSEDAVLASMKMDISVLCTEINAMSQNCNRKESLQKALSMLKILKKDLVVEITKTFKDSQKRGRKQRSKLLKTQKRQQNAKEPRPGKTSAIDIHVNGLGEPVLISDHHVVLNEMGGSDECCSVPGIGEAVEISIDPSEMMLE